ncbi:MAG: hypothetical protein FK734_16345 [Asgard group archaeon]|nr:hypothetical protein [Asgard group archaeon]
MDNETFCSYCGAQKDQASKFCSNCGADLDSSSLSIPIPNLTQAQSQQYHQPIEKSTISISLVLGIIGLIIGVLSLAVFSWHTGITDYSAVPFVYLGLSILGIVLSIKSFKKGHKIIGISGLVLNIIGCLILIVWLSFILLLLILSNR